MPQMIKQSRRLATNPREVNERINEISQNDPDPFVVSFCPECAKREFA